MMYELERDGRRMIGILFLSPAVERMFRIGGGKKAKIILAEELVKAFGSLAFPGYTVKNRMMMRVTRNADLDTSVDDSDVEHDFSVIMKQKIESRAKLAAVRLEVDDAHSPLKDFVLKLLKLDPAFCFAEEHYFDYKFLFSIGKFRRRTGKYAEISSVQGRGSAELEGADSLIDYALSKNIFLSYPYDSMSPVLDLLDECAKDKRVQAIKITIYRLANHSRIVDALCKACERGNVRHLLS